MTPVSATQDEDLLIISEDVADSPTDMDFSFSFGDDVPSSNVTQPSPTLVDSSSQAIAETSSSLGDFSFDMFSEKTQAPELIPAETVVSSPLENISEGFGVLETSPLVQTTELPIEEIATPQALVVAVQETIVPELVVPVPEEVKNTEIGTGESLNDILSLTILKLQARQEVISTDKASKTSKEESIKEKIKELQAEVKFLEAEMGFLDSESEKITANVEQLESMKLDPVKEHNARRVAKK